MRWFFVLAAGAALGFASYPASAQTVQVTSGEHDGFTRIAMVLPRASDWQVRRTERGYSLSVAGDPLRWTLDDVFRPLTRERLGSIWVDPDTGSLELGLRCACHAIPFEPRPGIIVIDLRDGPPPAGSAFELGMSGETLPPLVARTEVRPMPRPSESAAPEAPTVEAWAEAPAAAPVPAVVAETAPEPGVFPSRYNWLDLRSGVADAGRPVAAGEDPSPQAIPVPLSGEALTPAVFAGRDDAPAPPHVAAIEAEAAAEVAAAPAAQEVRSGLVEELARAAAAGLVELSETPPEVAQATLDDGAIPNLRIGAPDQPPEPAAGPEGDGGCLPDSAFDLPAWGTEDQPAVALGQIRAGLLGEFDTPDPAAAARLVRLYLFLGFGAEAREAARIFAPESPDRTVWESLSDILDQGTDPTGHLAGQAGCDTAAALWAVLSREELPRDDLRNDPAVMRAFSALPPHLRRHLGPPLADRYLAKGLNSPAAAILAAIERAPGETGPAASLLREDLAAASGEEPDPDALAEIAATGDDAGVKATIDLIRLAAEAGPVTTDLRLAAEALARSREGTPEAEALMAATALALASQDDYAAAFARVPPESPDALPVWKMLAERGPDGAILAHAVSGREPGLPEPIRHALADRLIRLGLAEPAIVWLGPAGPGESEDGRVLRGRAEMLRGDARAALMLVEGAPSEAAAEVRRSALARLSPLSEEANGDEGARHRAMWLRRDWAAVAADGPEPWRTAAALREAPAASPTEGPLATGRALVEESARARAAIDALLASAIVPQGDGTP